MLKITRTDIPKEDIIKRYHNCKEGSLKERYHAVLLCYDGHNPSEIAKLIYRNEITVRNWIHAFNQQGWEGLNSDPPPGRPSQLTEKDLDVIKQAVRKSPRESGYEFSNWTCKLVADFIFKTFGIQFSKERVRKILHHLGFRLLRLRHKFILANEEERELFKKELSDTVRNLSPNDVLLFEDECTVKQHPTLTATWCLKGETIEVPTLGNHAKEHIFGVLNPLEGDTNYHMAPSLTADEFKKTLELVLDHYQDKKIILFVDNARWHTAKGLDRFLEEHKDRLELRFLPKYSPDLNPIERLWKWMRKAVTHNTFFETMEKLKSSLLNFFRSLKEAKNVVMRTCAIKA